MTVNVGIRLGTVGEREVVSAFQQVAAEAQKVDDRLDAVGRREKTGKTLHEVSDGLYSITGIAPGASTQLGYVSDALDSLGSAAQVGRLGAVGLAIGAIAAAAVGAAIGGHKVLEEYSKIADLTEKTELSANLVRGLEASGAKFGLTAEKSRDALTSLGNALKSYRRNEGELKDSLEEIDEKLITRLDKVRSNREAFQELADVLKGLKGEEQLKLGETLFGEENARAMLKALEEANWNVGQIENAAVTAGTALDENLVRRTRELKGEVDEAANIAKNKLYDAFGDLAAPVAYLEKKWWEVVGAIAGAVKGAKDLLSLLPAMPGDEVTTTEVLKPRAPGSPTDGSGGTPLQVTVKGGKASAVGSRNGETFGQTRGRFNKEDDDESGGGKADKAAERRQKRADEYIRAQQRALDVAKIELEMVGKSAVEKEKQLALARATVDLTDEEKAKVSALAEARAKLTEELKKQQRAQQDLAGLESFAAKTITDGLIDVAVNGRKASDVLEQLRKSLLSSILRAALMGEGPFGGFFGRGENGAPGGLFGTIGRGIGSYFGGTGGTAGGGMTDTFSNFFTGFASGGVMTRWGPMPLNTYAGGGVARSPQVAIFGEGRGPEAYVPLPDGKSIPVTMAGGRGAAVNLTVVNNHSGARVTPRQDPATGDIEVLVDDLESRLARRTADGGPLSKIGRRAA